MDESTYPQSDNKIQSQKIESRQKYKILGKSIFSNLNRLKLEDLKASKIIFKVHLYFFIHILFIITIYLLSFKIKIIHSFIYANTVLFNTFLILAFISLVYPLFNGHLLKITPYNYFYLIIFTISFSYILYKLLISMKPESSYEFLKISSELFIFQLIFIIINQYVYKREYFYIIRNIFFFLFYLLFIGIISHFIEKISFFKLMIITLIIRLIYLYLIYDEKYVLYQKRPKLQENDFVLATIYLYIDIFIYLELFEAFYKLTKNTNNTREPANAPTEKKETFPKRMIYTGDKEYENLYERKDEEENKKDKITERRSNSDKGLKKELMKLLKNVKKRKKKVKKKSEKSKI